jgi:hypothetical protein
MLPPAEVNPSSETPSFTAPRLSSEVAALTFRLVVSDGKAPPSAPDKVTVQDLDTGVLEVTKAPREARVMAGTLRAGTVGRLSADDNAYYQVNSTQSGTAGPPGSDASPAFRMTLAIFGSPTRARILLAAHRPWMCCAGRMGPGCSCPSVPSGRPKSTSQTSFRVERRPTT